MFDSFGEAETQAADDIIDLALAEDLGTTGDLTCRALINPETAATVAVVSRESGVLAGIPVAHQVFRRVAPEIDWNAERNDGDPLEPGVRIATLSGPLNAILTGERTALNFLTHLSGVARLTRQFVDAVAGTNARVLDTRKTLPGFRGCSRSTPSAPAGAAITAAAYMTVS